MLAPQPAPAALDISPVHRGRRLRDLPIQSFFLDQSRAIMPKAGAENPSIADFQSGQHVLELGCGAGFTLNGICMRYACQGVGVDRELAAPPGQHPHASFVKADVLNLPEDLRGRFDRVFSYYTWHYLEDKLRGLHQAHQALKVGGRAIIDFGSLEIGPSDTLINPLMDPQLDDILRSYPNRGQISWERINIFDNESRQERRCCRVQIHKTSDEPLRFPEAWHEQNNWPKTNRNFRRCTYY